MSPLVITLIALAAEPTLEEALQRAVTRSPARVELQQWDAPRCRGSFVPAPFENSGRVAVRVRGKSCEAWGWATVKVLVPVVTLTRDVKANEPLDGAWAVTDTDAKLDALHEVPAQATATRSLRQGALLVGTDVRVGPRPGTAITVKVLVGALSLEQRGTVTPCTGLATCATLPSGKRVAGLWADGVLVVQEGTP